MARQPARRSCLPPALACVCRPAPGTDAELAWASRARDGPTETDRSSSMLDNLSLPAYTLPRQVTAQSKGGSVMSEALSAKLNAPLCASSACTCASA